MIKELDLVVLTHDHPDESLKKGDVGTIVLVHGPEKGYEVEFTALDGTTLSVVTLPADDVRPTGKREIAHVRRVA